MSQTARTSISWFLIAAMFTATMGISVHQIYCYCAGQTTLSIFDEAPTCAKTEAEGSCCQVDLPACCAKGMAQTTCSSKQDDQDCTKKTTKVFQLKVKYLVEHTTGFKSFDLPFWVEDLPLFKTFFREALCCISTFNKAPPPPPRSGRDIGIRLQIFRC